LGIFQALVAGMICRGADIAPDRNHRFQNAATGLLEELPKFAEVIFAPAAAQTGRVSKTRAAGLAADLDL